MRQVINTRQLHTSNFPRSHLPTHSSKEITIIFGSLTTCDPGNIHDTLDECVKDKIRISVVALAAEMKICRELCDKTGGGCARIHSLRSHRSSCSISAPAVSRIAMLRPVRRCSKRRPLQRPSLRAHPTTSSTRCLTRCGCRSHEPRRRPHDDGLSNPPPEHVSTKSMCMPLGAQKRRIPMSPLLRQGVRRTDRLRHLRTYDRELTASGEELSPFVPCEALQGSVRLQLIASTVRSLTIISSGNH